MTSDSPQSVLHHVIEVCRESEACFIRAASAATDAHLRKLLGEYSEQRSQFALQLEALLRQMGMEAEPAGVHNQTWADLQGPMAGASDSILHQCARAEEIALETYRAALTRELPEPAHELLESQYRQVEEVRIRMAELQAHVGVQPTAS
jgi:uncharacterized protein (TIGR02284 family)